MLRKVTVIGVLLAFVGIGLAFVSQNSFAEKKQVNGIASETSSSSGLMGPVVKATPPSRGEDKGLSEEVLKQIAALSEEKKLRTPAEQKIDSRILQEMKMHANRPIAEGILSLETGLNISEEGFLDVDIRARVSDSVMAQLAAMNARIYAAIPQYESITASIPLSGVDTLSQMGDVAFIGPRDLATTNKSASKSLTGSSTATTTPPFVSPLNSISNGNGPIVSAKETRAENVRNSLGSTLSAAKPAAPFIGSQTSQADTTHRSGVTRADFNINGAGLRIGVLSDGVNTLAARQGTGDLPPTVTVLAGQAGSGDEGTAMLEIVYDVAPGAQLFFATGFTSAASMAANIVALRAAGCDIIIDDVSYFAETPFQDGQSGPSAGSPTNAGIIIQAVNTVTTSGALYFSSAANSGNVDDGTSGAWEGNFNNSGINFPLGFGGATHDFGGSNLFNVVNTGGNPLFLKWSDPLGLSGNDYDLYTVNLAGTAVTGTSANVQDGNDDPVEAITPGGSRRVVIVKFSGADRFLHLNANRSQLSITTPGIIYGHNGSRNTISVAATPASGPFPNAHSGTNVSETFTSDGPRRIFFNADGSVINGTTGIVLNKPDITAADGVTTTTPGFIPFFGTSASAPQAGAMMALLKQASPASNNTTLFNAMTSSAIDIEAAGWDRNTGFGIFMPIRALNALNVLAPTATSVTTSQSPIVQGQNVTFTATVIVTNSNTPAVGNVQFRDGGTDCVTGTAVGAPVTLNGSGVATVTTNTLTIGAHTIRACYLGTVGYATSNGTVAQVILNPIFTYNASSNPLSTRYTLRVNGANYEIRDTLTNALLASQPIAGTTQIVINGQNGILDVLTVDFGGGNISPVNGINFNGGTGGPDSLITLNGNFATGVSTPANANDGTLVYTGGFSGPASITYTGLEPITDTNVVVNYTIFGTAGANNISLINNPANNGQLQVNSSATPTFELINFTNKVNVLIDSLAGADNVTVNFTVVPGLSTVRVNTGNEFDNVNVISLPSIVTLNIDCGGGGANNNIDNVTIGNSLPTFNNGTGSLLNVNGPINITAGFNANLLVDNSGDLGNRTYSSSAIGAVPVFGGAGSRFVSPFAPSVINSTAGVDLVAFAGGSGNDTLTITSGPGSVAFGGARYLGNGGDDTFNITGSGLGATNDNHDFFGGPGKDAFNVSPKANGATTRIRIFGDDPTTFPGDTLVVNTAGVTAPVLAIDAAGNGTFTSSSHQTIFIAGIEIQASTTTTIAATAATTYGGPVTFTATVATQAPGVGAPTGTVTFTADGLPIAACAAPVAVAAATATTSTASCTTSVLSAGVHAISAVYAPTGYYTASTGTSTHTVNKASLTVTADPQSKTYGAVNPPLTATITGFVLGQNLGNSGVTGAAALSTTATQTSPVGTYPISVSVGTLQSSNYTFTTFVPGTLTVGKATLTYTADNQTRVFGAANPAPTFTVTGFVAGDTLATSGVTGAPTIAHTATAASTVAGSPYAITISAGSLASANYLFAFAAGSLAVTPAATTTTITNAASLAATTTVGQTYPVNVTVAPVAPSTGTPTGTITVSDGAGQTCTITAPSGTCNLTATAPGPKAVTASYPGDGNFTGSNSGVGVPHNVVIGVTGNIKQFIAFGTNTNLAGVTVSLTGSGTASTTTDANGNYSFGIATAGGSYTVTPSGLGKQYEAVSRSYTSVTTNISGADFIAYDVPGPNALPRGARIQNTLATAGQPVTLPVLLNGTGVERVISFSMETNTTVLGIPTVSCGVDTVGCTLAVDTTLPGKVGIRITTVGALASGLREIAKVTYPTFATTLSESPVRFGDFPTTRDIRNSDNNPLPTLYWTDGIVRFSGGTLIGGPSISGRVLTPNGQALRSALVVVTDAAGARRTAVTSPFGNYSFENLESGQTYIVTVDSKRFRFAPRIINLTDSLTEVDLVGMQ